MPNIVRITDLNMPELAPFTRLTEHQLRSRRDPGQGLFIAESPKVIHRALDAGCAPRALLMEERHITGDGAEVIDRCGDIPVYTGSPELLASLTGYRLTRGVLCAMNRPALPDLESLCAGARRVAVLEGVADTTNVGAIFRSAAALGVDAVLVTPNCCDPLNRRAVRVSMGTVFQVPWTVTGPWPEEGLARLNALGFKTAALALTDRSLPIDDPRPAGEEKLAVILGTEGDGLAASTIAACDYTLRIPMSHRVDSLNVAAAGAVAFWELRPRQEKGAGL